MSIIRQHCNHERIISCCEELIGSPIVNLPFYGELSQYIVYKEDKSISTAGVNVTSTMNFYYNPKFMEELKQQEANFVVLHEFFHILYNHGGRAKKCLSHNLANIAQDMIINSVIKKDLIANQKRDFFAMPQKMDEEKKEMKDFGYSVPDEYKGEWIFEELYEWLKEQNQKAKDEGKPEPYPDGYSFDVHMEDGIPEEAREQMIKDLIEGLRNRGLCTGNIEETLGKLRKKTVNLTSYIKRSISQIEGTEDEDSFQRPNRRGLPTMGLIKRGAAMNVLLDTSGSMHGYFETVLSYIFRDDVAINLIQCDTEVKVIEKVKSRTQLQKMKLQGLGGTTLQPGLDLIKEKYNRLNTVILTDGATDTLDTSGMEKVLIITCDREAPVSHPANVKQIIVTKM